MPACQYLRRAIESRSAIRDLHFVRTGVAVKKNKKGPVKIQLPKDALRRVNLGQSFAEYDKVLTQQGVFVVTPAALAAQEPVRSKCFFVGRRGTGKTAITVYLGLKRTKHILQLHPEIFAALCTQLNLDELRDPRKRPFHSLVACFKRGRWLTKS